MEVKTATTHLRSSSEMENLLFNHLKMEPADPVPPVECVDEVTPLPLTYSFVKDSSLGLSSLKERPVRSFEELRSVLQMIKPSLSLYSFEPLSQAINAMSLFCRKELYDPEWDFFTKLYPLLLEWALDDTQQVQFPPMVSKQNASMVLTSFQVRYLLANSFFLNTTNMSELRNCATCFGSICQDELYTIESSLSFQRLLCLFSYFLQVRDLPHYTITYERFVLDADSAPNWKERTENIACDSIYPHTGSMEISSALGFADFANEFIHIGHITPSMTQEEVLFSCCPECFPVMLWAEEMDPNEVVIIRGVRRFSSYTGYTFSFQWAGFYEPIENVPEFRDVLVMDASMGSASQFEKTTIIRDLNKAYLSFKSFASGVSNPEMRHITTGHWGCGAFGGEKTLKFLQQVCAASLVGVKLDYSTFNDTVYCEKFVELLDLLKQNNVTVGQLVRLMKEFNRQGNFRDFLLSHFSEQH